MPHDCFTKYTSVQNAFILSKVGTLSPRLLVFPVMLCAAYACLGDLVFAVVYDLLSGRSSEGGTRACCSRARSGRSEAELALVAFASRALQMKQHTLVCALHAVRKSFISHDTAQTDLRPFFFLYFTQRILPFTPVPQTNSLHRALVDR